MEKKRCVFEIQEALRDIHRAFGRIQLIGADGIFGRETKEAVKCFQSDREMEITGEVDYFTWREIFAERKRALEFLQEPFQTVPSKSRDFPLRENEENYLVRCLNTMLSMVFLGFKSLDGRNIYDSETKKAVREWQRVCRIKETGICDKKTWNRLSDYCIIIFEAK